MSAFIDIDTDHTTLLVSSVIDNARHLIPSGNHKFRFCQSCGEEIPPQCREALPGVMCCIECASNDKVKLNVKNPECSM